MPELSSPLQIAGLIETNCKRDKGIYSIYRFVFDDYGNDAIGFAFFYGPENDMDGDWLQDVRPLWENGKLTAYGQQHLDEEWRIDKEAWRYKNNKNETIKFGSGPYDKNGNKVYLKSSGEKSSQPKILPKPTNINTPMEEETPTQSDPKELQRLKKEADDSVLESIEMWGNIVDWKAGDNKTEIIANVESLQLQDSFYKLLLNPHLLLVVWETAFNSLQKTVKKKNRFEKTMQDIIADPRFSLEIQSLAITQVNNKSVIKNAMKVNRKIKKIAKHRIKVIRQNRKFR